MSVSEALEPIDETSLKRAKEIICGGESWVEKTLRLSRRTVSASSSKGRKLLFVVVVIVVLVSVFTYVRR